MWSLQAKISDNINQTIKNNKIYFLIFGKYDLERWSH